MIKFLDIKKITESFQPELNAAVENVINSGWFLLGEEVKAFESEYGEYVGSEHTVGVGNGLDALRMIFKAYIELGVMKAGDEVIVPANTYIASILSITDNHLKPVLVEPDPATFNIDIDRIEDHITQNTKAILIVHLYGKACWSEKLIELASRYKLKIIEDNAQASGAMIDAGRRTGSLGNAAGHSFYPGKNLGALGDGGAVTTSERDLAETVRAIANYGSNKKYVNDYKGINSRLDEIHAAVLRVKLQRLDIDNQKRREVARFYSENIKHPGVHLPEQEGPESAHVWHLFVVRSSNREGLQEYLKENGIQTLIHYPIPPHRQKAYKELSKLILPVTEKIHEEVLSLPISQVIEQSDVKRVVDVINGYGK